MKGFGVRILSPLCLCAVGAAVLWAQPIEPKPDDLIKASTRAVKHRPVYIEDSPAAQELADEALDLAKQGRTADAAQKLQRVMDDYPFKLMPVGGGDTSELNSTGYTDAVLWVRIKLLEDPALLTVYRSLFGPTAIRRVELAMPTADKPIDTAQLRDVLTRHTLTRAGLDAALALGAYHLERAEGQDAWGVLDELIDHPDLAEHQGRYHFQRALAALLLGDPAAHDTHRAALQQIADSAHLAELDDFANRVNPPLRLQHPATTPDAAAPQLPNALQDALWVENYLDDFASTLMNQPGFRGVPQGYSLLRVLPGIDHRRVYLNLGDRVAGIDLASGWRLWETENPATDKMNSGQAMTRRIMTEPRGVYVASGRVYSLVGWVDPRQNLPAGMRDGVSLVCLNADTGKEHWRIKPWELDPAFEKASFDGTPIGDDGRVYTLVKRVQVSGLHDLYLTAVSADNGRLLWRRHIASSSTEGNYNTGPLARMILHHGTVYVTDNRGTVCALDSRIGTVRWLTILPGQGPDNPTGRRVVIPVKDIAPPVIVKAGLVVPPALGSELHVLLDPTTGRVVRELNDDPWPHALACYAAGDDLMLYGQGVTLVDGDTLSARWHSPPDNMVYGTPKGRPAIATTLRPPAEPGDTTANASQGVAVLATDRHLISLSLADGQVIHAAPSQSPGNVVIANGQVLVARVDSLHGYTDWHVARNQLTRRAEQHPHDPQPGLALARLALRTGRDPGVIEGIDLALASLDHPGDTGQAPDARRHTVLEPIREIIDPASGASVALRGQLLDRMATAAATPRQEATYQIIRGLYREEVGEPARAVEHYQAVLADSALSAELYTFGRGSVRADLEAQRLLKSLIKTHGRELYASFDLLAEHELNELITQGESRAQRYTELADRYPLAVSANNARLVAADLQQEAGQVMASLRQLQTIYLSTESPERLAETAGRIAQMYQDDGRPDLARRWLRRVHREHPDLLLTRDDQPVRAPAWLSELSAQLAVGHALPRFAPPLTSGELIPGRPMSLSAAVGPTLRHRVLMRDHDNLWMLDTRSLTTLWTHPLPAADARLLAVDDRQVVWWSKATGELGAWDTRSGQPLWDDIDFGQALRDTGEINRKQPKRTDPQVQFAQILGGANIRQPRRIPGAAVAELILTQTDLTSVLFADRLGRIVCIDRHTGEVRWRRVSASDNLTALALGDGLIAIAGASWADTQVQHGVVTLLDSLTGEQLDTQIQTDQVPTALSFSENGHMVVVGNSQLAVYDPASGRTQWNHTLPRQTTFGRVWVGGRLLIAATYQGQAGSALVMDLESGSPVNQVPIRTLSSQPYTFQALPTDDHWHVFTTMQATALDTAGRTHWADALSAPVGHLLLQQVGEQHLCLISRTGQHPVPVLPRIDAPNRAQLEQALHDAIAAGRLRVNAGAYRLYLLDRATGRIQAAAGIGELPGPIDPQASVLLDRALLLGVGEKTLLFRSQPAPD